MTKTISSPIPKPVVVPFVAVFVKDLEPDNFMLGAVRGADYADAHAKADELVRRQLGEECGHPFDDDAPPSGEELAKHHLYYRFWMTEHWEFASVLETIDSLKKEIAME